MTPYDLAKDTRDINLVSAGTARGARIVLMCEARTAFSIGDKTRAASLVR